MKEYLKHHEWQIIEEGFDAHYNKISESVFSIGNGRMGQRANFEEEYSGDTLQGSYVAGVYYPDKTRVGWWKNGYPEYFAKVLNAPSWIGIHISIDNLKLDLAKCKVINFVRTLDMKTGLLTRKFSAILPDGKQVNVEAKRFCSMANGEVGAIRYALTPVNFSAKATISIAVDADVVNKDSNYDEKFWEEVYKKAEDHQAIVVAQTKKTKFHVATGMRYAILEDGREAAKRINYEERDKYAGNIVQIELSQGKEIVIYKFGAILSSENHAKDKLVANCQDVLTKAAQKGFDSLLDEHAAVWKHKWDECDITIEGDIAAQQGIRFNIFQLTQTYTGEDERLNIGPKGFTGEKYGGSTYWDTEAYCLPFYLGTAEQQVAKNLLIYRHKHLQRAIENAGKLGFKNGAALYPMVTMNGEECHNEWEITFEEIHRNGAIAYAIYDYIRYTGDESYLSSHGLDVLVGISRFWAQRVNFSKEKNKYVMLGVTGPNEYENNVNNNWYTNYIARWTLNYTFESLAKVKAGNVTDYSRIVGNLSLKDDEIAFWKKIADNIYLPEDKTRGVILQQDGFLDKDIMPVSQLAKEDRPLNQKWSWDRILRSCFIKQADVLQGLYFFEDDFDTDTIKRNFDFYEPMTVHESSLSPCVHVILASKLGYEEKAYEMYLRTSRLDLDDYNNDTEDGCHITSMAGTWLSVIKGFGGMRVKDDTLHFTPFIPKKWKSYSFRIEFRGRVIKVKVSNQRIETTLVSGEPFDIKINNEAVSLSHNKTFEKVLA
ncbi:MAG TPA: glycoside hydrolase family 65 protein [Cyclobacteriaceae bacterium]|nr:glycoside hydrolase family 65 protein [Cyclobacteriaceae bacterium]HMV09799.1 glycoside hydrolase family 65 protein [Cyclobacteriaceae bacterium]HMV89727.1 glycoside hydrolase family 65 protein [Cyclobacteriaceae bacterium]HMX00491.1 glycoside hydrolase family 65 protein [Cyclobacteriaceae bacterium]HMX50425.1 glycoside hydrolase family 65 protein [Cyclobacteriaceae bacterium]